MRRDKFACRYPLKGSVDCCQKDRRLVASLDAHEPRQRCHALCDDGRIGRHPIIGQTIPGRKLHYLDIRSEKGQARDKAAIRCPSRQITASEIAGASLSAAIARARSASTSPSAPSATCARSAACLAGAIGRRFGICSHGAPLVKIAQPAGIRRFRNSPGTGSIPFIQAKIC